MVKNKKLVVFLEDVPSKDFTFKKGGIYEAIDGADIQSGSDNALYVKKPIGERYSQFNKNMSHVLQIIA